MKIIVMSDSHGDVETVKTVSALPADTIFHCGDSELSLDDPLLHNIHVVRGNCDRDGRFPESLLVEVGDKRIFVLHGHEHDCKRSMLPLYYEALERQADIVLFGHSHLYGAEMKEGILFVNPGSTLLPRGGNEPSFVEIEWDHEVEDLAYEGVSNDVNTLENEETLRVTIKNLQLKIIHSVEMKNYARKR
ncbi:metallophosphoesterase [Sporosarcina sp. ITBMC105]